MSSLAQRMITACLLASGFLLVLFMLPAIAIVTVVTLGILLGAWEWSAFLGLSSVLRRSIYVAVLAALTLGLWQITDYDRMFSILMLAALGWWVFALGTIRRYPVAIGPALAGIGGMLTLLPLWYGIIFIINELEEGPKVLFLVLLVVAAADIGAFFVGRSLGRRKLAPAVSPGKTVEGLCGGLLAATGAASVGVFLLNWPLSSLVVLGLGVGVISAVGDLTVSMFKR
ncbi:MAG: phosphatidate cytidylyltransferase, partial [Gammaproteobacteria bacterium]